MAYSMEQQNFYEVLDLPRSAPYEDIKRQYMHLSMRYHPLKNHSNLQTNQMKFAQVCEAFDVLFDSQTRAIYDAYGEYGLKEGIVKPDGTRVGGGYFLKTNPDNYFEKMFGDADLMTEPRANEGSDAQQSIFNDSYGGAGECKADKPADVEVAVDVTLEELYAGVIKHIEYTATEMKHDAKNTRKKTHRRTVQIRPGCSADQIVIENAGNQVAGNKPSNVVIKINRVDHCDYKRVGNDLVFTKKISLLEAISQQPCTLKTLDGRSLTVTADDQVSPQSCKLVRGEGMPIPQALQFNIDPEAPFQIASQQAPQKGDLYVRFDIHFPTQFTLDCKTKLLAALAANEADLSHD